MTADNNKTATSSAAELIRNFELMLKGLGEITKIEVEGFGMHDKVTIGFNVNKPIPVNPMQHLATPFEEGMKKWIEAYKKGGNWMDGKTHDS